MLRSLKPFFLVTLMILLFEGSLWACETKLGLSLFEEKACKVNEDFIQEIDDLQKQSSKHVEELMKDAEFKTTLSELERELPPSLLIPDYRHLIPAPTVLYVFVSFSMGEKALLNLAHEASLYGATLVLRGFKENSHQKTVMALQKIIQETGQGFLIDPELFEIFRVESVPTVILSREIPHMSQDRTQTPRHDRLQGHVSLHYATTRFAKEGDLKNEAKRLLKRRTLK